MRVRDPIIVKWNYTRLAKCTWTYTVPDVRSRKDCPLRGPEKNKAIPDFDAAKTLTGKTVAQCETACREEEKFFCKSFNYQASSKKCTLQIWDKEQEPLASKSGTDYYELNCNDPGEPEKTCSVEGNTLEVTNCLHGKACHFIHSYKPLLYEYLLSLWVLALFQEGDFYTNNDCTKNCECLDGELKCQDLKCGENFVCKHEDGQNECVCPSPYVLDEDMCVGECSSPFSQHTCLKSPGWVSSCQMRLVVTIWYHFGVNLRFRLWV